MHKLLVFSNILLEVILGLQVPHVCFTEAFHIRQMTDTLLRPQKELILMWL